jgi:hypothetical protein
MSSTRKQKASPKKTSTTRAKRDTTVRDLDLPVDKTSKVKGGADAQKQQMERWKIMQDTQTK